ncbi:MAG: T9SS type A sorting domain-containing protein [Saprospiraceae bacterium]|nr:T9SS type A sorting domain-containing protein [Saprospiraceae bacterium]
MKFQLLLSAFLLAGISSPAQVAEFSPAGAEWFYSTTSGYTTAEESFSGYTHVQYTGDILLDGRVCKKMCSTLYLVANEPALGCGTPSTLRFLFQQNDSLFEYIPQAATDKLRFLFRTHYALGDTVRSLANGPLTVQAIDTLVFNGQAVLQFWIGDSFVPRRAAIYDRFGPERGIFNVDLWDEVVDDGAVGLRCYQDNFFSKTNLSNAECEQVARPLTPYFAVDVLPNPVHTELQVLIRGQPIDVIRYSIWNTTGNLMLEDQLSVQSKTIPVAYFPAGMYLIVFQDSQSSFYQKFIKN